MQRLSRYLCSLLVGVVFVFFPANLRGQIERAQGPRGGATSAGVQRWEQPPQAPVYETPPRQSRLTDPGSSTNAIGSETSPGTGQKSTPITKNASSTISSKGTQAPSPWSTFGALAVVVVLILVSAKIWKKHGPLAGNAIPHEAVELLGRRMIDQRQAIHLVRLGSRILVLGSSPAGLRTLSEITDPVEADLLAGLCQKRLGEKGTAESFRALFKTQTRETLPADSLTGTIKTSSVQGRSAREIEQRLRAAGEVLRHDHPERIQG